MLAVVDKPLIQYAVEECIASGIEHIIIVTGRGKSSIEDHFDLLLSWSVPEDKGKTEQVEMVRSISDMVQISYTRQKEPLGLGHAVLVARELVGDEPFAVLLGDVMIPGKNPATGQLSKCMKRPASAPSRLKKCRRGMQLYGIVDGAAEKQKKNRWGARLLRIKDLVEKPEPEKAPSNLGVTGRYVLPPEIFDCLARTKPGAGGEIQLTDGVRKLAGNKQKDCRHGSTRGSRTMRETSWDF